MYTPDTRLDSKPLGFWTKAAVLARTKERGGSHIADVDALLTAYWSQDFINPEIASIQAAHETGWFTSDWWKYRLNPAGMGVTGDPQQNSESPFFSSGKDAANAHITHLLLYDLGTNIPSPFMASMDPRWQAAIDAGYAGKMHTIGSLTNTWAKDDNYATKLCNILNGGNAPMEVQFIKKIATGRLGGFTTLRDQKAHVTIHENGNPRSSPLDEASFVANGGGTGKVMYHFAVGVENNTPTIIQIFPLHKRGKHSGNSEGNAVSIAIETCQAPPGALSTQTQAALREVLYMIYTHDKRIDWGTGSYEFSPDRTRGHYQWPGANPGCPENMIKVYGGVKRVVDMVRERLVTGEPTYPDIVPIPALDEISKADIIAPFNVTDNGIVYEWRGDTAKAVRNTPRFRYADMSATVGPDYREGEYINIDWTFTYNGTAFGYTPSGVRVRLSDLVRISDAKAVENAN